MAGFLVKECYSKNYTFSRLNLPDIGMDPDLNGSPYFSRIMSTMEEMYPGIIIWLCHQGIKEGTSFRHMAILTTNSLFRIRALFPFKLGTFHPYTERIFFIVTVGTEFCCAEKFVGDNFMSRRFNSWCTASIFGHTRLDKITEIKWRIRLG